MSRSKSFFLGRYDYWLVFGRTYVFTFDSLGGRHPQAVKKLASYLKMEAKDKKNIDETGVVLGKTALVRLVRPSKKIPLNPAEKKVPSQGNFCDCGIYLLHFAQTFLSDAKNYANVILVRFLSWLLFFMCLLSESFSDVDNQVSHSSREEQNLAWRGDIEQRWSKYINIPDSDVIRPVEKTSGRG